MMKFMKGCRALMSEGWSQEFDLQSVPEYVMNSIQDNMKMWDAALKKQNDIFLSRKQEELRRLEAKLDELMIYNHIHEVKIPEPKYCKYIYCPCANGGEEGLIIND